MPHFYFDLKTAAGVEQDDLGAVFPGLEPAYLDACQAVLEISMDMLRDRKDPSHLCFKVRDEGGLLLMEIPFAEVLNPQSPPARSTSPALLRERLQANLGRARALKAEIAAELAQVREELELAQATLRRSTTRG